MNKIDKIAAKGTQVTFLSEDDMANDQVTDLGVSKLPEMEGKPQMYSRQLFLNGTTDDGEEVGTIVYIMSQSADVAINGNIPIRLNKNNNWVGFIA